MRMLKYFSKFFEFFLPTKIWKNHPQKLLRIPQIHFFVLTALTAQTAEFMFQNLAYWPTVYRTGILTSFCHFIRNHPQKLLRKTQIHFFFLTAWGAQMAQSEEFMFQNVAYRPTVYRTGVVLLIRIRIWMKCS